MRIAIIPARGGSKRIPRKNIRDFHGRPLISWSIEAAKKSQCFDRIVVSTDDAEIKDIALQYGAEVPFMRPAELANDYAGTIAVIKHAVTVLGLDKTENGENHYACCIYPTAPLLDPQDIQAGWEKISTEKWEYAFSVTDFEAPVYRAFVKDQAGGVSMLFPEHFGTRSQDLPVVLHDAGQFYWGKAKAWLQEKVIFEPHSYPVIIPRWRVQDIDTEDDFIRAEMQFSVLQSSINHTIVKPTNNA